MIVKDYVLVAPQLTHKEDWVRGQIIGIEDNPFRGNVITVRMEDGNVYWDVVNNFKEIK